MNIDKYLANLAADKTSAPSGLIERISAIPDQPTWWQSLLKPSWQTALAYALPLAIGFAFGASPWQQDESYPLDTLVFEQEVFSDEDFQEVVDDA